MNNKQILVTGATKGIGRAIVELFASKNFDVLVCARSTTDLKELKHWFDATYTNQEMEIFTVDLSKKAERKRFSEVLKTRTLDILVNNAGVFIPGALLEEQDGVLEQMIETNLYSAYDITKAVVPQMKKNKQGQIFNICSTASITAYENGGSYCISKFALLGFSKVLRQELKNDGVKVTSVLPGATFTSSWEGVEIPEERFMPARDVAQTIWEVYNLSNRTVVEEILLRPMLGDL